MNGQWNAFVFPVGDGDRVVEPGSTTIVSTVG
jgi:hypothetical protein